MSHAVHHITHSVEHAFHHVFHDVGKVVSPLIKIAEPALNVVVPGSGTLLNTLVSKPQKPKVVYIGGLLHAPADTQKPTKQPPPQIKPQIKPTTTGIQKKPAPIGSLLTDVFQPLETDFFKGGFGKHLMNDVKDDVYKLGSFFKLL